VELAGGLLEQRLVNADYVAGGCLQQTGGRQIVDLACDASREVVNQFLDGRVEYVFRSTGLLHLDVDVTCRLILGEGMQLVLHVDAVE